MTGLLFNEKQYQPQTVRGYQEDAIQAVQQAWDRRVAGPLVASATGSGKTTIISELLRRMVKPSQQRAILIAHTEEIITQMRDRVANQFNGELDERDTDCEAQRSLGSRTDGGFSQYVLVPKSRYIVPANDKRLARIEVLRTVVDRLEGG